MSISLALALAVPGRAGPPAPSLPADALLLFVADWCAPCHAEVARLPAIAAAVRPLRVRVVGMDAPGRGGRLIAAVPIEQRWTLDPADHRRVRSWLFAQTPGLPFSIVTDARGRACARSAVGLTADRARAVAALCRSP